MLLPLRLPATANATPTGLTPFTEKLPTLDEMGAIDATAGTAAEISMVNAKHLFHKAMQRTPTFAYRAAGGTQDYLGPVIIAKRDVPFTLTVHNNLNQAPHPLASAIDYGISGAVPADATAPRTSTHLHGGNTDPANDGDPMSTFVPGTSSTYQYQNTQEAAGLWYHDHAMGITRLNVLAGLASGYLIRDANDTGDGVLLPAYLPGRNYEVPLILQDRSFNTDGTFEYPPNSNLGTPRPWAPEFFGNVPTVNGKVMPNLAVDQGKYRFRVYNGSNARFYDFKFSHGGAALPFFQIGTDGGLLNYPVKLNKLLMAPGERADLVVDFGTLSAGAQVILTNDAVAPYPTGARNLRRGGSPLPQIMQFTVTGATGWTKKLNAATSLRANTWPVPDLSQQRVVKRRTMTCVEVHNAAGSPLMVLMNNANFAPLDTMSDPVKSNTLEQWDLVNTTVDAHPMHLHFAQFQLLNRQSFDVAGYGAAAGYPASGYSATGFPRSTTAPPTVDQFVKGAVKGPAANEAGWKDTILAMPGQVTRILVPFGPEAVPDLSGGYVPMAIGTAYTGDYVSHCHILEHEDNDMMMRYQIQA